MKHLVPFVGCLAVTATFVVMSQAADHADSPAALADPAADLTDLYAWMSPDAEHLNLVLNWHHMAPEDALFSDAVAYQFHIKSSPAFGEPGAEPRIVCRFYEADGSGVECWAGDEYVAGDPRAAAGITSESGRVRVFADRRNDPFFFELVGFRETVRTVVGAAGALEFDTNGCPDLDDATSAALVAQLQHGADGAAASDTFAGSHVLSLVLQVDKTLVTTGGPIVGVWAAAHSVQ